MSCMCAASSRFCNNTLAVVKGEGEIIATTALRERTDRLLRETTQQLHDLTPPGA